MTCISSLTNKILSAAWTKRRFNEGLSRKYVEIKTRVQENHGTTIQDELVRAVQSTATINKIRVGLERQGHRDRSLPTGLQGIIQ